MWVKYRLTGSGVSPSFMYDQIPANSMESAKKIILARNPGATSVGIHAYAMQKDPPDWWPGEKEKKEEKRQEEKRRLQEEENRKRTEREAKDREREAQRNARREEERRNAEREEDRREIEKLRQELRNQKKEARQSNGEFWSKGEYDSFTDIARDQKDGMYEKIMNCQTNILTAPLKLICWLLHEIFNPYSFFRKHVFSVVNVILVLAGIFAYNHDAMLFVILCAVSVVANCIIGMKTDRSGIALLVVFIEVAVFAAVIWFSQSQTTSGSNNNAAQQGDSESAQITDDGYLPPASQILREVAAANHSKSGKVGVDNSKNIGKNLEELLRDGSNKRVKGQGDAKLVITDPRDGKVYRTVEIGKQVWFAQNLNYASKSSHCFGDKEKNCDNLGRLYKTYDKNATKNVCPAGWHVPSIAEWKTLLRNVGLKQKCGNFGYEHETGNECDYLVWNRATSVLNRKGFGIIMGNEFGMKNQTVFVANKTRDNVICFSSDNEASDYCFQDSMGEYYIRCVQN